MTSTTLGPTSFSLFPPSHPVSKIASVEDHGVDNQFGTELKAMLGMAVFCLFVCFKEGGQ